MEVQGGAYASTNPTLLPMDQSPLSRPAPLVKEENKLSNKISW